MAKRKINEDGWTKVPIAILDHPALSWEEEWLWVVLRWHTRPKQPHHYCWPSHSTLAEWTGLSEWQIRKASEGLKERELLRIEKRPGWRANFYGPIIPAGKWVAVPNRLLADPNLRIVDKLLFIHLFKALSPGRKRVFMEQAKLAEEMARRIPRFTRRQVQLSLERLERYGYLISEWPDRRKPKAYSYAPFLGEPDYLSGYDRAQEEPVHQGDALQKDDTLLLEGLHPQGEGDHGNGRRSLAGISVHHADIVQNRAKPSSKAPDSQRPLTPPTESSQADAPRTGAVSRPEIVSSPCISVHQDVAEQDSKFPRLNPLSHSKEFLQLGGEGGLLQSPKVMFLLLKGLKMRRRENPR
jgi:hypothetical protein